MLLSRATSEASERPGGQMTMTGDHTNGDSVHGGVTALFATILPGSWFLVLAPALAAAVGAWLYR